MRLRVWFDDGTNGSQLLTPDQRIASVGYAMVAQNVADGAITGSKLAADAVQSIHIAPGAVGNPQLANSGITINTGAGMSGGGTLALGGNISLENAGVLSLAGGGGITVSGSAGAITLGSNATELNTPGTLVMRDASGGFAAGDITATSFTGSGAGLTGVTGTFPWQPIAGTTQQAVRYSGYLATNAALVTVTLPTVANVGDIVRVNGVGAGGWAIVPDTAHSVVGFGPGLGPVGSIGTGVGLQYIGNDQWQPIAEFQLAAGAVQTANIAAGAVDNSKLANSSITLNTGPGLAGGGVLAVGGTMTLSIPNGGIDGTQLAADSIQASHLADGAVENTKLANSGITINTGAGLAGGGPLALGGTLTLTIPNGGIGSDQLAPNAVQTASIAPSAVGATQLAAGAALANLTSGGLQALGSTASPTFAGAKLLELGSGFIKPSLVLDRGIGPKGRLTYQKTTGDSGWSGLVLGINANWNDETGYAYDDEAHSQSIFQMEYEYSSPIGLLNEMNWTSRGRRIWFSWAHVTDSTKASVQWLAPSKILVPEYETSGEPALVIEDYKGGAAPGTDGRTTLVLQNSNPNPGTSIGSVIRMLGLGGGGTDWYVGTDSLTNGGDNFFIRDSKTAIPHILIDATGKVGINTGSPAAQLDVNGGVNVSGTVNATSFTVNGGPIPNLAKQTESRFAAELRNYFNTPDTVSSFLLTPSSLVIDGATIIKLLSLSPDKWRGKTVKLQMIVGVNGNSGGDLAYKLAIAYRNTAIDGVNGNGSNVGDSDGSLNNTATTTAAPVAANKLLLIESPAMTIPADVTALSGGFALERTPAKGDTNTDVAYIVECRVIEQ